jgi:antitoxin HicB
VKYTVVIKWSDDDQTYVVFLPEWEGLLLMPCTSGKTYEEAARNGQEVLEMMIEGQQEEGKLLPQPQTYTSAD